MRGRKADDVPAPHPALVVVPSELAGRDPSTDDDLWASARAALDWTEATMTQPHPDLGRGGAVCPFVAPSLARDHMPIAVHPEVDGSTVGALRDVLQAHALELRTHRAERATRSILVVLPSLEGHGARLLDNTHRMLKGWLAERAMMAAPFHSGSTNEGARSSSLRLQSSVTLVALRHMAVHDVLFTATKKRWFLAFHEQFGAAFDAGRVSDPALVEAYTTAARRWQRALRR